MSQTYVYPFDPTGSLTSNVIPNERHVLSGVTDREFNFIVPKFAPFFRNNLRIRHLGLGRDLVEGVDYHLTHWFHAASHGVGRPVYGSITFIDRNLTGVVELRYQTIGGDWVYDEGTILELMSNRLMNPRITTWEQVVDLPFQFPVIDHEWDLDDLTGAKEIVETLEGIINAINVSNDANGTSHVGDTSNPHRVTKAQVGLNLVENYPMANIAEATAGLSNELYMTPVRVRNFVENYVNPLLETHTLRNDNPHGVTKTQVGLGNVQNYGVATAEQTAAGTSNTLYVTPVAVKATLDSNVFPVITAHTTRTDNPHGVTKAQVGLNLVENLPLASQSEAIAGSRNDRYMTPLTTYQMVSQYVGEGMNNHISNMLNPHRVNKEQVGLGLVQNFAIATPEEAVAGISNTLYITPMGLNKAIEDVALANYREHTNDGNNPHGVTKAQVGLGQVDNYPTATIAEAKSGVANNRFMTPATTSAMLEDVVGSSLEGHALRKDNPHAVTKEQVGLGSVDNYPTATIDEAREGTVNNRFMTPATTSAMLEDVVGSSLVGHIENMSNPHGTTKTQVGLGLVDNYPTATIAEAVAGIATNRFMTPATTQAMLENVVGDSVSSHASRQDNPHQVTKSQVGLGNVDNFATASQAEAMEGTSETLFMTPYTTLLVSQGAARELVKQHSDRKDNPHGVTAAQLGAVTTEELATQLLGYMTNGSKAVDSAKLNGYTYEQIMSAVSGGQAEDTLRFGGYTVPELEVYLTGQIAPKATRLEGKTLTTISNEILAKVTSPQTAVFAGHESEVATDRAWTRLFSTDEPRFEAIVTLHEQDDARSSTSLVRLVDADGANGAYQDADHVIICGEDTGHIFRIKAVGERKELWVESGAQTRGDIHCQVVSAVGKTDIVFSGEVFEGEPDWAEFDLETADEPVITPTKVYLIDNVMLEARLDAFAAEMRSEALESIDQAPE